MTHTIRAYHQGKKVYESALDDFFDAQSMADALKPKLLDGSADFIEITDHTNARKTRRIYAPRRNR